METSIGPRKLELDQESLNHLNTIRKWTMFLAIIGFIVLGIIIAAGLIAGTFLSAFSYGKLNTIFPGPLVLVPVFIIALIYFFPGLFLFRFSKHTAHAVIKLDKKELYKAIKNLKLYFVYVGIIIIIGLLLYIATLIITGTSMAFFKDLDSILRPSL